MTAFTPDSRAKTRLPTSVDTVCMPTPSGSAGSSNAERWKIMDEKTQQKTKRTRPQIKPERMEGIEEVRMAMGDLLLLVVGLLGDGCGLSGGVPPCDCGFSDDGVPGEPCGGAVRARVGIASPKS